MADPVQTLGSGILNFAADELAALKSTLVGDVDAGISAVDTQVKQNVGTALKGHGVLSMFSGDISKPFNAAVDALAAQGEADAGKLFDEGVAKLRNLALGVSSG